MAIGHGVVPRTAVEETEAVSAVEEGGVAVRPPVKQKVPQQQQSQSQSQLPTTLLKRPHKQPNIVALTHSAV